VELVNEWFAKNVFVWTFRTICDTDANTAQLVVAVITVSFACLSQAF